MYVREKIGTVEKNLQMGKTPATISKLKLISARGIAIHMNRYKLRRFFFDRPATQRKVPSLNCAVFLEQSMGARNRVGMGCRTGPSYRPASAGILEQSMGAGNRVGIGLSYRPARLHRLAESIPMN